jgi:hypothetical protein
VHWHLVFRKVFVTILARLPKMHLLNVLFLIVNINELATLFALSNISAAVGVMTMHLRFRKLTTTVVTILQFFLHFDVKTIAMRQYLKYVLF